jgi:hypothetical protein
MHPALLDGRQRSPGARAQDAVVGDERAIDVARDRLERTGKRCYDDFVELTTNVDTSSICFLLS